MDDPDFNARTVMLNGDAAVVVTRGHINMRYNCKPSGSLEICKAGTVFVSSGCIVRNVTLSSGGMLKLHQSGTCTTVKVDYGACLDISGGYACDFTIVNHGSCYVSMGGALASGRVFSGGHIKAGQAGVVRSCHIMSGGTVYLVCSATANYITVMSGGTLCVWDHCSAHSINVMSGGTLFVEGSHASKAGLSSQMCHNGWAKVTYLNAQPGATVNIGSYANVEYDPAEHRDSSGWDTLNLSNTDIESGDTVEKAIIRGGICTISSGASIVNCVIDSTGDVVVKSGATLRMVTVNPSGQLHVCPGADVQFHALPGARVRFLTEGDDD